MRLAKLSWFIIILIIFFSFQGCESPASPPSLKPGKSTVEDILYYTPIGTDMEDAIDIIKKRLNSKLGIHYIDYNYGYALSGNPSWAFTPDDIIIGSKSIRGYFRIITKGYFFDRSHSSKEQIFWGFDEEGKLIDVYIWIPETE